MGKRILVILMHNVIYIVSVNLNEWKLTRTGRVLSLSWVDVLVRGDGEEHDNVPHNNLMS